MEIRFRDASAERVKTGLLVIPVREKKLDAPEIRVLDRALGGNLRGRIQKSRFTGAENSTLLYPTAGSLPTAQLLLVGMGGGAADAAWSASAGFGKRRPSAPMTRRFFLRRRKVPRAPRRRRPKARYSRLTNSINIAPTPSRRWRSSP